MREHKIRVISAQIEFLGGTTLRTPAQVCLTVPASGLFDSARLSIPPMDPMEVDNWNAVIKD